MKRCLINKREADGVGDDQKQHLLSHTRYILSTPTHITINNREFDGVGNDQQQHTVQSTGSTGSTFSPPATHRKIYMEQCLTINLEVDGVGDDQTNTNNI